MKLTEERLREQILSDPYHSAVFRHDPGSRIFLVGGYLRDALIGRQSKDRDYVVRGGDAGILNEIREGTGGKIVYPGNKGLIRIVTKGATLDFSFLYGSLHNDLSRRDFTINAMAWRPETGLVDPHNAASDLSRGILRAVSRQSIPDDPVRILRAYRFAADLAFQIESGTRQLLRMFAGELKHSPPERITLEFFKILNLEDPISALTPMEDDRVLSELIPCKSAELRPESQVLSGRLEILKNLPLKYLKRLSDVFSQELSRRGLLLLEDLLEGSTNHIFSLSVKMRDRVLQAHAAGKKLSVSRGSDELFEAFEQYGQGAEDYLLRHNLQDALKQFERYHEIRRGGQLTTEEVIKISGISPGRRLGSLLRELRRAEFLGNISGRQEAERLASELSGDGI